MWKTINGFENYEINAMGEIKNKTTNKYKKLTLATNGYFALTLYKNNKGKTLNIHRLIATLFIENPNNLPTVNHKDGNKTNNSLSNLEWASYGANNQHAYDNGLKKVTKKMMAHSSSLYKHSRKNNPYGSHRNPIQAINITTNEITEFPSVEMAATTLGYHRGSIDKVLKGKRASSKGFTFKYSEAR